MKRSTFLLVTAILAALIGFMSLFFPSQMAEGFGVTATPMILLLSRELGVFNLCTGGLNFLVRHHGDSKTLKAVLLYNLVYHAIMLVVNAYSLYQGAFTIGQAVLPVVFHVFIGIGSYWYGTRMKASSN